MEELKRPEVYYFCSECEEFHHPDEIEDGCDTSKYVFEESMDYFLFECSEKLLEAKRLRKNAEELDIIGEYESEEKDNQEASKLEEEVIGLLRGTPISPTPKEVDNG
jgi:hypothetical protein